VREDRVLRKIFGHKREEVTGDWTALCSEELNDLCCYPNVSRVIKSRRMRWAGHVARIGERRGSYRVLVGDLNRKRPFGKPRRRMGLQELWGEEAELN
jgi:hypothetical protein